MFLSMVDACAKRRGGDRQWVKGEKGGGEAAVATPASFSMGRKSGDKRGSGDGARERLAQVRTLGLAASGMLPLQWERGPPQ